jgi:hypothetical protein
MSDNTGWPAVPVAAWSDTRDTVHLWTQIVGKVRLALEPPANHWWQVALYVDAMGLTTSLMPYGDIGVQIGFDFCQHRLTIRTTDGRVRSMELVPRSVADFYTEFRAHLDDLAIAVPIHARPVEVAVSIPFADDTEHASYDAEAVHRFWLSLVATQRVFTRFRGEFRGKSSPVHFFWGAFDLAVTRFSGRAAPPHGGGIPNCPDWVMTEAYSEEVSSCGYWPGGDDEGAFYSYAYPEAEGYRTHTVQPDTAGYDAGLGEFLLPYSAVRTAADPDEFLLQFLRSTFDAAATSAQWPAPVSRIAQSSHP